MKKVWLGVLCAVMVLSVCAVAVLAAGPGGGRCFADADGDGLCDNAGKGCAYADADGDGVCGYGAGRGQGCGRGGRCGRGFRGRWNR